MKTNTLNSSEQFEGFFGNFSIFSLMKKDSKNYSDPSEPFRSQQPYGLSKSGKLKILNSLSQNCSGSEIGSMDTCLHGRPCPHLHASGGDVRPTCRVNKAPVFDLEACPHGWWFKATEN